MYTIEYFIKKFTNTRDDKWITGRLHDGNGASCANGWCGVTQYNIDGLSGGIPMEATALNKLFFVLNDGKRTMEGYHNLVPNINNGNDPRYQQSTPKERILAACYDIQAILQGKDKPSEKKVYVAVDAEIREEAKQLQETN